MANEYLVNSDDLVAVADAIRTKGGTSEALDFPGGFVDAVGAIETGGDDLYVSIANDTITEINDDKIRSLRSHAFRELTKLTKATLSSLTSVGFDVFNGCTKLSEIHLPVFIGKISDRVFNGCNALSVVDVKCITRLGISCFFGTAISEIDLSSCTEFSSYAFSNCANLKTVDMPLVNNLGKWSVNVFYGCIALERADLHNCSAIGTNVFNGCTSLATLILRGETVCTLSNINSFTNTPLTGYGGTYSGHVWVPSALIPEYQAATNWSTLYANYPEIFQPIEGSEYE